MAKKPADRIESVTELASKAFAAAIRAIGDEIQALTKAPAELGEVAKGKTAVGAHDPTDRIAMLASKVAVIVGEQRKLEKARTKELADLTSTDVVAWARMQSKESRARVLRELAAIDNPNRRSVLG